MPLNKALTRAASTAALTLLISLPLSAHAQGEKAADSSAAPAATAAPAAAPAADPAADKAAHNGSVTGTGTALEGAVFDITLPPTYERCQNTDGMIEYLKTIPRKDTAKLKEFHTFVAECQKILNEQIAQTKERIKELKEQAKP